MTTASAVRSSGPFVGSDFGEDDFQRLRALLVERRGFDLGMYKDGCIKRRIAIRVRAHGFVSAAPYLALLEESEKELDALLAAVSIHVSQFFRNPTLFRLLEREIFPKLQLQGKEQGRERLRFWSAGCASGEEPYSLALLCSDAAAPLPVEILASDLSAPVLQQAAQGEYDATRLLEVPPPVRERYFEAVGARFRLKPEIRARVRFAPLDLLGEAPYPKADLILCRNVLIYFGREEQARILERFFEALPVGGVLVLGKAETLLPPVRERFVCLDTEERVYQRLDNEKV